MIGLKKRNIKKMLKLGAKAGGVSFADVQTDIEATIDETMTSTDPQVQENFKKLFGSKRPTSEEYIYKIAKKTKVTWKRTCLHQRDAGLLPWAMKHTICLKKHLLIS